MLRCADVNTSRRERCAESYFIEPHLCDIRLE